MDGQLGETRETRANERGRLPRKSAKKRPGKTADGRSKWKLARPRPTTHAPYRELTTEAINMIQNTDIQKLPEVIDDARHPQNVAVQEQVISVCLERVLSHAGGPGLVPHVEQVRTLRRLIFSQGDVLLIARTGFGKSLIFHAYSILTRNITLQLVPLTKLGEEQLADIRKFPGARSCLVNTYTRGQEKDIIQKISDGVFTHVLLGPEQATSDGFRRALKRADFQARIGLVAIDECHLVSQWETFRPAFTMLAQLRTMLHPDIVWFGCSATLDYVGERKVLDNAGFRRVGGGMHQTAVIRTSVDRPDISLSLVALPRGKVTKWGAFFFLLKNAIDSSAEPTPQDIPKTVVFLDSRRRIHAAAAWTMQRLLLMTAESHRSRYSESLEAGPLCVLNVVGIFTANMAAYDQEVAFLEFQKPTSTTRIMFATTSLGAL